MLSAGFAWPIVAEQFSSFPCGHDKASFAWSCQDANRSAEKLIIHDNARSALKKSQFADSTIGSGTKCMPWLARRAWRILGQRLGGGAPAWRLASA
jgi:hypothetical protein